MSLASSASVQAFGTQDGLSSRVSDPLLGEQQSPSEVFDPVTEPTPKTTGKRFIVYLSLLSALIVVVVLAVVLPVYFVILKPKTHEDASNPSGSSGGPGTTASDGVIYGGNGSTVLLANGTSFTYMNNFGGYWVHDPENPFNDNARPNSWTPPLNSTWTWGVDRIYGVNLGGWLVLEPFITPDIYQRYPTAVDEWTLSVAMAADTANGGLNQLEQHYDTFISEEDIAEMAAAGLNFIRVPLAFWAVETWTQDPFNEPFLARTSWKYFLRFLGWARKYGLRVCLDLHAVPGSQNGYNHSGRLGSVNFLYGNMGIANAERTLYYLRVLTEFISQPEYRNLIPIFGIMNEALVNTIGVSEITSFYLQAHDMIRNITGLGEGPYIAIHDGFLKGSEWAGFLQGSDRIMLDKHSYFSFGGSQPQPLDIVGANGYLGGQWPSTACSAWGGPTNASRSTFGVTFVGEFAASPNDCGLFLHGVNAPAQTPNCSEYDNWSTYTSDMKQGILDFVMASMDAFGDWYFWTWKIAAAQSGDIETPLWSYQLGYRNGWMPSDPRSASGFCESVGYTPTLFGGTFSPWQTGTPSSIPASSSSMYPWPPTSIGNIDVPMSLLPTYTNTATIITLPVPTFTSIPSSVTQGYDGWFDTADTGGGIMTIAGCTYLNEYSATFAVTPTAPCPAGNSVPTVATTAPTVPTLTITTVATATSSTGAGVLTSTTPTALTTTATS
ncbi:exo-beta-1,3-glucanase [Amanita rubescens]|nr:exo-beta-1,3-glucanase [Amanita rubescens]